MSARWEFVKLLLIATVLLFCASSWRLRFPLPTVYPSSRLWRHGASYGEMRRSDWRGWPSVELRAPRVALAILSGAALGLAGAMMQDGLRNPLAGPELLGVASGASLVVAVFTLFQVPLLLVFYPWVALMPAVCWRGPW